jgi:hypothetical protein
MDTWLVQVQVQPVRPSPLHERNLEKQLELDTCFTTPPLKVHLSIEIEIGRVMT